MSLIPLDDRRGDEEVTPPEGQPAHGGAGGLFERLRSALATVAQRLSTPETDDEQLEDTVPEKSVQPGETAETLRQQLELVSSEADGTLTVTDAENPDATISSDTWESVDR